MDLLRGFQLILAALLLAAGCVTAAYAHDCTRDQGRSLSGADDIRHAVSAGETIVISSKGSHAVCGATPPPVAASAPPDEPRIEIPFEPQSAAVSATIEPDLHRVAQHVQAIGGRLRIAAFAYADNPSYAARLAHARAEAVRSLLLSVGFRDDAIELRAWGGRQGRDRVELDLTAAARGPPAHG